MRPGNWGTFPITTGRKPPSKNWMEQKIHHSKWWWSSISHKKSLEGTIERTRCLSLRASLEPFEVFFISYFFLSWTDHLEGMKGDRQQIFDCKELFSLSLTRSIDNESSLFLSNSFLVYLLPRFPVFSLQLSISLWFLWNRKSSQATE